MSCSFVLKVDVRARRERAPARRRPGPPSSPRAGRSARVASRASTFAPPSRAAAIAGRRPKPRRRGADHPWPCLPSMWRPGRRRPWRGRSTGPPEPPERMPEDRSRPALSRTAPQATLACEGRPGQLLEVFVDVLVAPLRLPSSTASPSSCFFRCTVSTFRTSRSLLGFSVWYSRCCRRASSCCWWASAASLLERTSPLVRNLVFPLTSLGCLLYLAFSGKLSAAVITHVNAGRLPPTLSFSRSTTPTS